MKLIVDLCGGPMKYWSGQETSFGHRGVRWTLTWWTGDAERKALAKHGLYAATCRLATEVEDADSWNALRANVDDICLCLSIMSRGTVKKARYVITESDKRVQERWFACVSMAGFTMQPQPHRERGTDPGDFIRWALPRLHIVQQRVRLPLLSHLLATANSDGGGIEATRVILASCLEVIRHDYLTRTLIPEGAVRRGEQPNQWKWTSPPEGLAADDTVGLASTHRHLATSLRLRGSAKANPFWSWFRKWRNDALHDPGINDQQTPRDEFNAAMVILDYIDALVFALFDWDEAKGCLSRHGPGHRVLSRTTDWRAVPQPPILSSEKNAL